MLSSFEAEGTYKSRGRGRRRAGDGYRSVIFAVKYRAVERERCFQILTLDSETLLTLRHYGQLRVVVAR